MTLVLVTAGVAPRHVEASPHKLTRVARAFAAGTIKDGPQHTWKAITAKPVQYGAMLVGIGMLGAGARAMGIDPEPFAIALSGGALGLQLWKSLPEMRDKQGLERVRSVGANVVWPTALAVGTVAMGKLVGHGDAGHGAPSPTEVAGAGAKSVVIAGDAPTITQTALGAKRPDDAARR